MGGGRCEGVHPRLRSAAAECALIPHAMKLAGSSWSRVLPWRRVITSASACELTRALRCAPSPPRPQSAAADIVVVDDFSGFNEIKTKSLLAKLENVGVSQVGGVLKLRGKADGRVRVVAGPGDGVCAMAARARQQHGAFSGGGDWAMAPAAVPRPGPGALLLVRSA